MKLESLSQFVVKWRIFLIAGMISILVVLGSFYYYHSEEKRIKEEKHNMLKAVADLKSEDIIRFVKGRQADLNTFAESQIVIDNIELFLKTNNKLAKEKLIQRMSLAQKYNDYENVLITSPSGIVMLSLDSVNKIDPLTLTLIKKAKENFEDRYSDLYFCPTHKTIHFDLISPLRNEKHSIIALIILRVNPEGYLYPLLKSWPTPSKSSEVLLVQKDGNDVLFLNELKFQKNTALKLRYSLTNNNIPAVQAVQGLTGIFEGKDYRGVDVLSDLRPIVGTPWFMISKIDQSEIYSELYYRVYIIFLLDTIILFLLGIGLAGLHSTRQKNIFKQLYLAKSALILAQEEFRITLYSIGDAVITTNIDSLILVMNPIAEQLTGWKEQDAKGKPLDTVFKIIHEESREKVENPVKKVIEQGLVVGLANHTLLISKDGNEIPIADSGAPIRDQDKNIIGVVLVFRDQSKERAAQKALQESNLLIHNIVDNNPSLIYVLDSGGRFRLVNRALANIFGIPQEDFEGKVREEIMPQEIAQQHRNNDNLVINSKQLQTFEEENIESDGKHFYLTSKFPLFDSDGNVYAIGGISTDITERKRAEETVKLSEERYRLLFMNHTAGFALHEIILNDQGKPCDYRFLEINPAFETLTGLNAIDIIGKTTMEVMPDTEPYWIETYGEVALTGKSVNFENFSETLNKHYQVSAYSPEPGKFATLFLDITDHKEAERKIIESQAKINKALEISNLSRRSLLSVLEDQRRVQLEINKLNDELEKRVVERTAQLEFANKELESFSYSVSHDLRAPLRGIDGFSLALFQDYQDKLDDTAKDYIARIRTATLKMDGLIDSLLRLSRISRVEMKVEKVNLSDMVSEIVKSLTEIDFSRNTEFIIPENISTFGDSNLLKIVLVNLLSNAWKFTSKNDKTVIELGSFIEKSRTVYYIKDNGVGFEMKYADKVFSAFQRLHSEKDYPGVGVGLTTVQRIIRRHNGDIWVESALNIGTTFYFTL